MVYLANSRPVVNRSHTTMTHTANILALEHGALQRYINLPSLLYFTYFTAPTYFGSHITRRPKWSHTAFTV